MNMRVRIAKKIYKRVQVALTAAQQPDPPFGISITGAGGILRRAAPGLGRYDRAYKTLVNHRSSNKWTPGRGCMQCHWHETKGETYATCARHGCKGCKWCTKRKMAAVPA